MNDDPIVEQVRLIRDELARAFDYDIHAICADLRKRQDPHPAHPLVKDVPAWAESREEIPALREEPPEHAKERPSANRIGSSEWSVPQLKVLQECITLVVFTLVAYALFRSPLR